MKSLYIISLIILLLSMSITCYALTEDQCYFYNALLATGNTCLKQKGMLAPSSEEIKKLQSRIIPGCFATHKDATMAGGILGKKDLLNKASCDEVIDEYLKLFRKYGLSGKLVEDVPDDFGIDNFLPELR